MTDLAQPQIFVAISLIKLARYIIGFGNRMPPLQKEPIVDPKELNHANSKADAMIESLKRLEEELKRVGIRPYHWWNG